MDLSLLLHRRWDSLTLEEMEKVKGAALLRGYEKWVWTPTGLAPVDGWVKIGEEEEQAEFGSLEELVEFRRKLGGEHPAWGWPDMVLKSGKLGWWDRGTGGVVREVTLRMYRWEGWQGTLIQLYREGKVGPNVPVNKDWLVLQLGMPTKEICGKKLKEKLGKMLKTLRVRQKDGERERLWVIDAPTVKQLHVALRQ